MEGFVELGGLTAIVWAATEGIGRALNMNKARVALVLGPVAGVVAKLTGQMSLGVGPDAPPAVGLGVAAFMGLIATMAASVAHNNVVGPATKGSVK